MCNTTNVSVYYLVPTIIYLTLPQLKICLDFQQQFSLQSHYFGDITLNCRSEKQFRIVFIWCISCKECATNTYKLTYYLNFALIESMIAVGQEKSIQELKRKKVNFINDNTLRKIFYHKNRQVVLHHVHSVQSLNSVV